jgi:uncharacterized protein YbjQ (UPF0145 family)
MIVSTTPTIQNRNISSYKGIVCGEVIIGAHLGKDILASITNLVGGRSDAYEKTIRETRDGAINEMIREAERLGANAIVAVKFDYQVIGQSGSMMMVAASGTAVTVE